jgi:CDP-diacylglycerol--serine O-phosphatidyltransferase
MSDIDDDEESDDSSPKIYLLPNLMTAGNLFCGFLAILMIFKGMRDPGNGAHDYKMAIALILGACLFDLLDGRVARLRGQESLFGREFDSLADIVSFGVAPALLVMDIVLNDFSDRLGWLTAFVYLLCGGMRLARFNCLAAEDSGSSSKDFRGFPIPAAAGVIASITVFLLWLNEGNKELGFWKYGLLILMWLLSALMMSELSYPSFKHINWKTRRSLLWVFVAVMAVVASVLWWEWVPALLFTMYLSYGLVRPWVSKRWRREIEEPAPDDDEDPILVSEGDLRVVEGGGTGKENNRQSEAS